MAIKFIHGRNSGDSHLGFMKPVRILMNELFEPVDGQQTIKLTQGTYTPGNNELEVILNGIPQRTGIDFTEIDSKTIQFVAPLEAKDIVQLLIRGAYVINNKQVITLEFDADYVTLNDPYYLGGESLNVFVGGWLQLKDVDYYEENEYTLRFTRMLTAGTTIVVHEVR